MYLISNQEVYQINLFLSKFSHDFAKSLTNFQLIVIV
jgi:hypothetical protein